MKMRPFSWVILAVQALFVLWLISGLQGASETAADCTGQFAQACRDGAAIGTGIGVTMVLFLGAMVDVILGVIWVVTRKTEPKLVATNYAPARPDVPQEQWADVRGVKWSKSK